MNKARIAEDIIEKGKQSRYFSGTIYVTAADTARLLRAMLAEEFPGVKFWVRSDTFAGGSSVDVYFDPKADGAPSKDAVRAVVDRFGGADFDGMIDMQFSRYSWLSPSGLVTKAGTQGTARSRGVFEAEDLPAPSVAAVKALFGSWMHVNDYKPYGAA